MEQEFLEYYTNNSWRNLYTQICIESRNKSYASKEASKPENRHFNRYRDVYPYDHSRVPLSNVSDTDYINASLLSLESLGRSYLLTQGPLCSTSPHFWSMVWEQGCRAIIMLNRVIEKNTPKCHQYWPADKDEVMSFDEVGLTVENISLTPGQHYNISTLRLTSTTENESRDVLHFHYTTWPDFGVPSCPDTFLEFLGAVRESGSLESDAGPAVVHCSAGIGRSGSFVLVDSCLLEAETAGPEAVNIKQRLLDMRTFRMGLIQTDDQLKFSYQAIIEGARQLGLITMVPSFESDVAEASDSSEDDECPPPLPPPRMESLKKNDSEEEASNNVEVVEVADKKVVITDAEPYNSIYTSKNKPLTNGALNGDMEAGSSSNSSSGSAEASPNKCILTSNKLEERKREMELRRRKKEEEKVSTENKIKEVKKSIKSAEEWKEKSVFLQETILPFCVGLAMFLAGGYFYFRQQGWSSRLK